MHPTPSPEDEARFWSKVRQEGDCLIWTGSMNKKGYGFFWMQGRMRVAHRIAWLIAGRPLLEGMTLDHTCENEGCQNVDHMEQVTNFENIRRGDGYPGRAIRAREKGECVNGHNLIQAGVTAAGKCKTCRREPRLAAR